MILPSKNLTREPIVTFKDDPALIRDILAYEGTNGTDYDTRYNSRVAKSAIASTFGITEDGTVRDIDARVSLGLTVGRFEEAVVRYGSEQELASAELAKVDELLLMLDGMKQQAQR